MSYIIGSENTATTFTASKPCRHRNGWYGVVPFLCFERAIFLCSDCGKILYGKELRAFRGRK